MSIGRTIRVGIMPLERVRDYTLAIAKGTYKRKPTEPKIWFTSIKSFAAVLSDENRELLRIIHDNKPESIADLEQMTGRKASNLSRTLHTMANYGLVRLEDGSQGRGRRAVRPVALARCVNLTLDIGFGGPPAPRRVVRRQAEKIAA
ncbi:MAG: HVO_A0114 family putative DNA-binding protein [Burkholderiales bacterium]